MPRCAPALGPDLLRSYHGLAGDRVLPLKVQNKSWPLVFQDIDGGVANTANLYPGDLRTANCELTQGFETWRICDSEETNTPCEAKILFRT